MTSRNIRYAAFVAVHCLIAIWGILEVAERAIERQDLACQEGCE